VVLLLKNYKVFDVRMRVEQLLLCYACPALLGNLGNSVILMIFTADIVTQYIAIETIFPDILEAPSPSPYSYNLSLFFLFLHFEN